MVLRHSNHWKLHILHHKACSRRKTYLIAEFFSSINHLLRYLENIDCRLKNSIFKELWSLILLDLLMSKGVWKKKFRKKPEFYKMMDIHANIWNRDIIVKILDRLVGDFCWWASTNEHQIYDEVWCLGLAKTHDSWSFMVKCSKLLDTIVLWIYIWKFRMAYLFSNHNCIEQNLFKNFSKGPALLWQTQIQTI